MVIRTTALKIFVTDPYAGNINPATVYGGKLFVTATEPLDAKDRLEASIEKTINVIMALVQKF